MLVCVYLPSRKACGVFVRPLVRSRSFTLNKLECSKQAIAVNTLAWNNNIGLRFYFVGFQNEVMIDRDSWGC